MPVEMFMKMDGIAGESKNYQYKGWSDVVSWCWEMASISNTSDVNGGSKTSFKEISITKRIGMDSTEIMSLYAQGKTVKNVLFEINPVVSKRDAKLKYLSILMEDVQVKSITTGGNITETFFNETIVLLFSKIRFEYNFNTVATTDNPVATSVDYKFGWNLAMNQTW